MGHGGVYEVDGHGRSEPSVGGGELNFSSIPWGQEPSHPSIFFPFGLAQRTFSSRDRTCLKKLVGEVGFDAHEIFL